MSIHHVLVALSNRRRQETLERLARTGGASVSDLTATTSISRQAVLKQLRFLQEAGLVTSERGSDGIRLFRVAPRALREAARSLARTAWSWEHAARARSEHTPPTAPEEGAPPPDSTRGRGGGSRLLDLDE